MNSQTLYQRVLGEEFFRLPPVLQPFHSLPQGGCATGVLAVERGNGVFTYVAAGLLLLPRPGKRVPLCLQIIPEDGREIWVRHFDGQCVKTLQWQEGPYLIEKAGPLHFVFELAADEHGLTFHPHPNRIRGIPIPERLSLRINAHARGGEKSWGIEVVITAPLLGRITTYKGEITPHSC